MPAIYYSDYISCEKAWLGVGLKCFAIFPNNQAHYDSFKGRSSFKLFLLHVRTYVCTCICVFVYVCVCIVSLSALLSQPKLKTKGVFIHRCAYVLLSESL